MSWPRSALREHESRGTLRSLPPASRGVDFSSNDYLGLSRSPVIRQALAAAIQDPEFPLGATGSRLLSGNTPVHERVERFLAETFGAPTALLWSSGYAANVGVLSALGGEDTEFFSDQNNHASLIDGIRLARSVCQVFRHNDAQHLETLLTKSTACQRVIATESVFSMDGDLAPLDDLIAVAKRADAWLVVDEAHATGVFGARGLGRLEGRHFPRMISVHTGGKALGGQGAFVLAEADIRALLINRARSFIYSTALSPLSALQIEHALRVAMPLEAPRARLRAHAERLRLQLPENARQSQSQILPILLGSNDRALRAAATLRERGFDVRAIRSPTVAPGSERLRISLKSFHTEADIAAFAGALRETIAC